MQPPPSGLPALLLDEAALEEALLADELEELALVLVELALDVAELPPVPEELPLEELAELVLEVDVATLVPEDVALEVDVLDVPTLELVVVLEALALVDEMVVAPPVPALTHAPLTHTRPFLQSSALVQACGAPPAPAEADEAAPVPPQPSVANRTAQATRRGYGSIDATDCTRAS
jgi:hypothetical protein